MPDQVITITVYDAQRKQNNCNVDNSPRDWTKWDT